MGRPKKVQDNKDVVPSPENNEPIDIIIEDINSVVDDIPSAEKENLFIKQCVELGFASSNSFSEKPSISKSLKKIGVNTDGSFAIEPFEFDNVVVSDTAVCFQVSLKKEIALGNGTRPKDFVLGLLGIDKKQLAKRKLEASGHKENEEYEVLPINAYCAFVEVMYKYVRPEYGQTFGLSDSDMTMFLASEGVTEMEIRNALQNADILNLKEL